MRSERTLCCKVAGHGLFRLAPGEASAVRRRPGPVPPTWDNAAATLLRQSDEQTVAGLAAVFTAMDKMRQSPSDFEQWGIVAAPRFLGRKRLADAFRQFDAEGVWGVSPHLIPHFALHSPSGTFSLALGLHGPNVGVGGDLHSAIQGFLTALTWLATGVVPGAWLILSGWDPELALDRDGNSNAGCECHALALALVPADSSCGTTGFCTVADLGDPAPAALDLPTLAGWLAPGAEPPPGPVISDASGRVGIEIVPAIELPAWEIL
jgi:hypothetical protein